MSGAERIAAGAGPLGRLLRWFETRIDPDAEADGPPPTGFRDFMRWSLRGSWHVVVMATVAAVCMALAEVGAAWAVAVVVDIAGTAAGDRGAVLAENAWLLAGLGAFVLLARPIAMAMQSGLMALGFQPSAYQLVVFRLHRHTLGQSLTYFENDFAGRIAQKQVQTGQAATELMVDVIQAVAFALATMLAAGAALGAADPWLAAALVAWVAVYLGWVAAMLPALRAKARTRAEAQAGLSGQLVDTIGHMETVKLFAHAGREEAQAGRSLGRLRAAKVAFGRTVWIYRTVVSALAGVLPLMLVGLALWAWSRGTAGPGAVALAGLLSTRIGQMSGWISFTAMGMFSNVGVIEDGIRTLVRPWRVLDAPDAAELPEVKGEIAFENVTFRYGAEEGSGGGMERFSLRVRAGEKVALVGRSGAGKSTLLKLALRLHDPEEGRVTLDGRDLRGLAQDGFRRRIAMVTQDPAMFNRSALDNILYGRPDAGRAAAEEAAFQASAHGFIQELSDPSGRKGYDAHLGERGVKLSGGQRQRIALARAILKDAPVLLLDEATSALDSETEEEVQRALETLMEGRTVVAIAHRLSTIARMDRIVVLDAGQVAEEGTHADLLARGGLYAAFWARQSGGFMNADAA